MSPRPTEEEFEMELDRELERTLAMTPAENPRGPPGHLALVAFVGAPIAATVIQLAPSISELLPMAAHAPSNPPAVTAAAPPPSDDDFTPHAKNQDGGSR